MDQQEKKISINEKDNQELIDSWFDEARNMTKENLMNFCDKIMNNYSHDYGTIVHAITACAIATAWAMNKEEQGGITGFQASFVMWGFVQRWMQFKGPLKLVKYDEMLYPQYEEHFEKTITKDTFEYLQKEAQKNLDENKSMHPDVITHMQKIVNGEIPFGYILNED